MNKKNKEPLFHIVKRAALPWYQAWGIRLAALIVALIVCGILTTIATGCDPIKVYITMFEGSFSTPRRFWMLLQEIAILLCVSLAMTPAFRMRFWNIGGEGQVMIGCLASAACMILLRDKVSNPVMIAIMAVTSIGAGAIWAFIPAFFKAKWNTNETLFTLMMNYVAIQLVAFYVIVWEVPRGSGKIGIINQKTQLGWFPQFGSNKYLLNIIIVAILTVFVYIYMNYSKHGYELAVVGESERTARYVGIHVEKVIMRTMLLSGAICGLAGLLLVGGTDHTVTTTLAGGRGFTAVMVCWLAKFNPLGMIFTSFLLVFLKKGASEISTSFGLNHSFGDIVTGIIIFFIIGSEFFINYKLSFRHSSGKSSSAPTVQAAPAGGAAGTAKETSEADPDSGKASAEPEEEMKEAVEEKGGEEHV